VHSIPIFRRADGDLSAGTPSVPLMGADGTHLRGADGKKRYVPIVTFENEDARSRWNAAILAALADGGIA
jgi:hypothetical protein